MRNLCLAGATALVLSAVAAAAAAASYTSDAQQSRLEFVGIQAGAEFKGVFQKFTADVDFAPETLASSRIDVQIDMNSVDSKDKDRDTTIRGKDVFYVDCIKAVAVPGNDPPMYAGDQIYISRTPF